VRSPRRSPAALSRPKAERVSGPFVSPPILGDSTTSRVSFADTTLTGPEFLTRIHRAARHLSALRVSEGTRVAVDADTPLDRLSWFLGADVLGAASLLVEPTWTSRERRVVLNDARPAAVVCGTPECPAEAVRPAGDERSHFYLPTTSGSSGRPRVLVRTRESWLRSFHTFELGLKPDDSVLVPGPLSSSLFLFGALHTLHAGHNLQLLPRWSPEEAATACRAATVIHAVPAMLSALLSVWEQRPDLREECALRTIVCGGAQVGSEREARLRRVLPECELIEYYGSSEQSLVAIRRGDALRPAPGVDVEIRDDSGKPLPNGHIGNLWVRSSLLFDGYLDDGTIDFPAHWRDGWSNVGDYGTRHPDGTLTVHGRSSSTIASGGTNVSAEEVETALHAAAGVRDVIVSATPHPRLGAVVTAVLEVDPAAPPSVRDLRARAKAVLAPAKRPRRWLAMERLPRTAVGKPARGLVAERLREGTLDAEALS
jgi:long-chain acyl-CoA synthetase